MNEQRAQAYLSLINQLLSCNESDKIQILQKNVELLDEVLMRMMITLAQQFRETGRENEAQSLIIMAQQLGEALGLFMNKMTTTANNYQDYLNFLMEVLQKVEENPNPQVIYPFLQQNLNQFTSEFAEILQKWAKANFQQLSSENAQHLAAAISSFSNLMLYFPFGDRTSNLAIVKAGYESTLAFVTRMNFPIMWASINIDLGIAHEEDMLADTVQKWEDAINCYQNAAQIFTENSHPDQWASIQENLGNAYRNRQQGNKEKNLRQAINYYQNALQIFNPQQNPRQWGAAKHNLGQAYFKLDSLIADKSGQDYEHFLETAIQHFNQALPILKKDIHSDLWALCQMSLGNAYSLRLKGNPHENHQKAENYYQNALLIFTPQQYPHYYQQVKTNEIKLQKLKENIAQKINSENEMPFVIQLFRTVMASQDDHQKCFSFLEVNLDKINEQFIYDFIGFTTAVLQGREHTDISGDIFASIPVLSSYMMIFDQGNREINLNIAIAGLMMVLPIAKNDPDLESSLQFQLGSACYEKYEKRFSDFLANLEKAIKCFEDVISIFPKQNYLTNDDLALIKNRLGVAYFERLQIKGDVNDIQLAIDCYNDVLEIYKENTLEWAMVQTNLGNVYCQIPENMLVNLTKAIKYYHNALSIRKKESYPQEWADVQINMASSYYKLGMLGYSGGTDYIENSLQCLNNALEVYNDPNVYPEKWSSLKHTLGVVYSDRRKGNFIDNIESSISCLEQAFTVRTSEKYPYEWAVSCKNLGIIYHQRKRSDRQANLMKGIGYLEEALKVFTLEKYPVDLAETQGNLASLYRNIAEITEPKNNLTKAISCAEQVVITFQNNPQRLGKACFELATCYKDLGIFAEQNQDETLAKENFAKAIECYQKACNNVSKESNPFGWADITNSLGNAYQHNGQYDEAIKCYEDTLKIHTREIFPTDYIKTCMNLGNTNVKFNQLTKAFESYQEAINTLEEDLLSELATDDDARRKLGEEWLKVYRSIIKVCLRLGKENTDYFATAWEYAERSKARRLVEIFGQTRPNDISDETWREFMNLRNEITNTEKWIEDKEKPSILSGEKSFNDSELNNRKNNLTNLKQKLTQKLENHPQLKQTQKVEYTPFSQIGEKLSDDNTVIIQWYILASDQKFCAFIYTRKSNQPYVRESSFEDLKNLLELFREYFRSYNSNPDQWRYQLPKYLERLAKILQIDDLVNYLYKNHQNCQQVILIPHLDLHLFPIHALPVKSVNANQPEYFFECFTKGVRYAPSCQTLLMLEKRLKNRNDFNDPKFEHLFAVQNPTSDLIYADLEVKAIESYFNTADILVNKDAKKQKIIDNKLTSVAHCVHFSCHGTFKLESPIDSALILANNEHLTLLDIFKLNLNQCRLVTLSACETGITDLTSITDEYIGLPSGFLFAGSQNVVSSLWTVNDLSTAFLMIKFYQILLDPTQQVSVAIALKTAQNWLRTLNREQFITESNQIIDQLDAKKPRIAESYRKIAQQLLLQNTEEYPFQNPYYWAAFIASGQ